MNEKIYQAQIAHLRRALAALRLLDLHELQRCADAHGTAPDQDLIAALMLALETLPDEPHG